MLFAIVALMIAGAYAQNCRAPPDVCTADATGSQSALIVAVPSNSDTHKFQSCFTLLHTAFCVEYSAEEDQNKEFMNVTIIIEVDHVPVHKIHTTWPDLYKGDGVCIDDATILEILELIPSLQSSVTILNDLLQVVGCIPGGLVSICFAGRGATSDHCLELNYDFLYFENYCVFAGSVDLGCDHNQTALN